MLRRPPLGLSQDWSAALCRTSRPAAAEGDLLRPALSQGLGSPLRPVVLGLAPGPGRLRLLLCRARGLRRADPAQQLVAAGQGLRHDGLGPICLMMKKLAQDPRARTANSIWISAARGQNSLHRNLARDSRNGSCCRGGGACGGLGAPTPLESACSGQTRCQGRLRAP